MKHLSSFHQRSGIAPNERPRSLPAVLPFLGTDRRQARSRRGRGERRESGVRPSRPSWARTSPSSCRGLAGLPDSRQLPGSLGDSWRSAGTCTSCSARREAAGGRVGDWRGLRGAGCGGRRECVVRPSAGRLSRPKDGGHLPPGCPRSALKRKVRAGSSCQGEWT